MDKAMEERLRRQAAWLKESLIWILREKIIGRDEVTKQLTALDVGCGPGLTMELFTPLVTVKGVDSDPDAVATCRTKKLDAVEGIAERLPFDDDEFDIVYCSFLLLWVKDPLAVVREMKRVSKNWVVCFAEPDYGARLDHPQSLSELAKLVAEDLMRDGGDPFLGRKLRSLYSRAGMVSELGVHMGIWDLEKLKDESEEEIRWLEERSLKMSVHELARIRAARDDAFKAGSLFQFNPIFYAIGRKGDGSHR